MTIAIKYTLALLAIFFMLSIGAETSLLMERYIEKTEELHKK